MIEFLTSHGEVFGFKTLEELFVARGKQTMEGNQDIISSNESLLAQFQAGD